MASSGHLTIEEEKALLDYVQGKAAIAKKRGARRAVIDELVVVLLLRTGMKARELCGLNIEDTPGTEGPNTVIVRNRTGRSRHISIDECTTDRLRRFVMVHRVGALPGEPLLLGERGRRFAYASLYAKLKRLGQAAGIGDLTPNRLRRTFMVRLFQGEQDLLLVKQAAGHANLKTTAQLLTVRCQGCGLRMAPEDGTPIDSGQLLCPSCLREIRLT